MNRSAQSINAVSECSFPLSTPGEAPELALEELRPNDFAESDLKRPGLILVMFHADWCAFCRLFLPKFKRFCRDRSIVGAIAKLNEYSNPLWEAFGVKVIPTVVAFRDGKEIGRRDGKLLAGLFDRDLQELFQVVWAK